MPKFIVMPDSFKGTMSSVEICEIIRDAILSVIPQAEVRMIPVADGGEGSVECFLTALGGDMVASTVCGAFPGEKVSAGFALFPGGKTAAVEMASAAGLPMVDGRQNPLGTTTFGFGELILAAAKSGAEQIIAGLGGSCTNDGGCGMAAALGVRFVDENGDEFVPVGGTLKNIQSIDIAGLNPALLGVKITAMCDIDNPMYGESGAAYIFGPQKGADAAMVSELDAGLRHLSAAIERSLGVSVANVAGSGAAGALGAGMLAFLGAELKMGIDVVLDTVGFETIAKDADIIFTGEGKLDSQSLGGKVVVGIARRSKPLGVPVVAIVGDIGDDIEPVYDEGVTGVFSINRVAVSFKEAKPRSKQDLCLTAENFMRTYAALGGK